MTPPRPRPTELDQLQGLRRFGYFWGDIANRLGVTRQAVRQRWAVGGDPA
jgi:hypothetical protein